jgi:hypothetical protein
MERAADRKVSCLVRRRSRRVALGEARPDLGLRVRWRSAGRAALIAAGLVVASAFSAAPALAGTSPADQMCLGALPGSAPAPAPASFGVRFGIDPAGYAGVIAGPEPAEVPENQQLIDQRLGQLAGGRQFVVHLYAVYGGPASGPGTLDWMSAITEHYTQQGLLVDWVLRYAPASAPDVSGFVAFVRQVVDRVGPNPGVVALQVTNEVNQTVSPDASDGSFAGAVDALVQGIEGAHAEAIAIGRSDLTAGFNWFYRMDPQSDGNFWSQLAARVDPKFLAALGWIGLDAYPGTFWPPPPSELDAKDAMINAFSTLRCYAGGAGIPSSVPIHVEENGWPTDDPARTEAQQQATLQAMVQATCTYRGNYNITDYRWFDLRDANSSSPDFQEHFGLTTDGYAPKRAFGTYAQLVQQCGT